MNDFTSFIFLLINESRLLSEKINLPKTGPAFFAASDKVALPLLVAIASEAFCALKSFKSSF